MLSQRLGGVENYRSSNFGFGSNWVGSNTFIPHYVRLILDSLGEEGAHLVHRHRDFLIELELQPSPFEELLHVGLAEAVLVRDDVIILRVVDRLLQRCHIAN